jgi:hypothetical protein
VIGNDNIFANEVALAGHIVVEDHVFHFEQRRRASVCAVWAACDGWREVEDRAGCVAVFYDGRKSAALAWLE